MIVLFSFTHMVYEYHDLPKKIINETKRNKKNKMRKKVINENIYIRRKRRVEKE